MLLELDFGLHIVTQRCDCDAIRRVIDFWNAVTLEARCYAFYILARFLYDIYCDSKQNTRSLGVLCKDCKLSE